MQYEVEWRALALQQLARIWLASADRNGLTRDVDEVDQALSEDTDQKGEDYFGDRVLQTDQMWVLFRVHEEDRVATVLQVGRPGIDLPHENLPPVE